MKFDGNNKVVRKQHFLFAFLIQNYTKEDFISTYLLDFRSKYYYSKLKKRIVWQDDNLNE